jgi:hypothetical protein
MPPAFNLSQDQTLQFNPDQSLMRLFANQRRLETTSIRSSLKVIAKVKKNLARPGVSLGLLL